MLLCGGLCDTHAISGNFTSAIKAGETTAAAAVRRMLADAEAAGVLLLLAT